MINDVTTKGEYYGEKTHPARFYYYHYYYFFTRRRRPEKIDNRSASMSPVSAAFTPFSFFRFFRFSFRPRIYYVHTSCDNYCRRVPGCSSFHFYIIIYIFFFFFRWTYAIANDTRNERVKWLTTPPVQLCARTAVLFIYFFAPLVPFPGVNFFGNGKKTIKKPTSVYFPLWLPPNRSANDFRRRFPRVSCVVTHRAISNGRATSRWHRRRRLCHHVTCRVHAYITLTRLKNVHVITT